MNAPARGGRILLEVCIASVEDAITAQNSGADRLEVNSALELGGLTPTDGLVQEIRREARLPLIAMLRPRAAGFCYSRRELLVMCRDAERLLAAGADGLAFGILTAERKIDVEACEDLLRITNQRAAVFHRAFDVLNDQSGGLESLIDLGFERVLTSGGAATAMEGREAIVALQRQAHGRINIMPGGGIGEHNALDVLQGTGCHEVHGSFRSEVFDDAEPVGSSTCYGTDRSKVSAVRALLDRLSLA